ncbi:MAG: Tetratricopeptide (TPR) repeat [Verrucomicrobia bacterium]|nr:MAG: Tetratricopeptide (TPR) repeat [Verrucomicrobiota bacterium]
MQPKGMKRFELPLLSLLLGMLGLSLFAGTLNYPMVFDDEIYLVGNPIFKNFENFAAIFQHFEAVAKMAAKNGLEGDISTNFLMRPLTYLTFHWNHQADGLNPFGYRLVNVLIHFANALLVWRLASLLLEGRRLENIAFPTSIALIPCLSGLLFFVHPLQMESVIYIIQRATSLCTLFYLAAVICHFEANARASAGWRCASVLSVLGAMFTKESGVTAPVLAVLLDVAVFGTPLRCALWRGRGLLVCLPILPLLLASVSHAQTGAFGGGAILNIATGEANSSYALQYALTQPSVWLAYLRLLVWPQTLNIDPEVSLVKHASDFRFWGSALCLALLLKISALLRCRPQTRFVGEAACFGLLWFALTVSPDSSLVPLPDCMAEHRSYLPSVGIFIMASALLCSVPTPPLAVCASGLILSGAFFTATVQRCKVWSSAEKLWRDVCDKSPGKPRPWLNLAAAYFDAGKLEESEATFLHSIQVAPTVPAFANLAFLNLKRNLPERAFEFAQLGMNYRPSGYDQLLLIHFGDACVRLKRWQPAVKAYREALEMTPSRLDLRLRLSYCLLETFNTDEVLEVLRTGLRLHPDSPQLADAIITAERFHHKFKLRLSP